MKFDSEVWFSLNGSLCGSAHFMVINLGVNSISYRKRNEKNLQNSDQVDCLDHFMMSCFNLYITVLQLAPIKLNRYGEDLLFFLFYMNSGDVLQLASGCEL